MLALFQDQSVLWWVVGLIFFLVMLRVGEMMAGWGFCGGGIGDV